MFWITIKTFIYEKNILLCSLKDHLQIISFYTWMQCLDLPWQMLAPLLQAGQCPCYLKEYQLGKLQELCPTAKRMRWPNQPMPSKYQRVSTQTLTTNLCMTVKRFQKEKSCEHIYKTVGLLFKEWPLEVIYPFQIS